MRFWRTLGFTALLAGAVALGWFGRGWMASPRIEAALARADAFGAQALEAVGRADSMAVVADGLTREVRAAEERFERAVSAVPEPVPADVIEQVIEIVPDTVRVVIEAMAEENTRLRDALVSARYSLEVSQDYSSVLKGEIDALRNALDFQVQANDALERALAEAMLPPPWWKSDIAVSLYGAAAGALIERSLR